MLRRTFFALFAVAGVASASQAALLGAFDLVEAGKTTNDAVYMGQFDTWTFSLTSNEGPVTSLDLDFAPISGEFLNTAPPNTVRDAVSNPIVFGFEAPETFGLVPAGLSPLIGSSTDSADRLRLAYTTNGGHTIVEDGGIKTAVAFFSVPAGQGMPNEALNLEASVGVVGGARIPITFIPEPSTFALAGLALVGLVGYARRRK